MGDRAGILIISCSGNPENDLTLKACLILERTLGRANKHLKIDIFALDQVVEVYLVFVADFAVAEI